MKNTRLDEEFPALSSISRGPNSLPTNPPIPASPPPSKIAQEQQQMIIDSEIYKDFTPNSDSQSTLIPDDFGYALDSVMNFIPETPYESDGLIDDCSNDQMYPRPSHTKFIQPEFFKKYDNDTLFFIFFYSPGTPQQYFASKELKSRGWAFNITQKTWFRAVGEPTDSESDFQTGKFEYFDHKNPESWMIRQIEKN
ncbi:nuclear-transcribed mRNA catabolic process, deadenylation-dependent decay [Trichomonas vaginalis G3]|uniref:nuclear-transcribed mRNA catabolic process, deadenylation-dependent decay n=1 Tax=Trichomonas vaginalis (strain ATCC PRA-98 / G3) TaxID=412133 RepID=UPI0021E5817F|nr:nuclear-transcribed mRNA catabolic process, deadenylation-dependent decay [Trichomonas vaginalis G3]KAI5484388.1 nuclear-transcribed mRNA catabolic process, deadenylation-dependent decay [Trichomonas vaginalis G3]